MIFIVFILLCYIVSLQILIFKWLLLSSVTFLKNKFLHMEVTGQKKINLSFKKYFAVLPSRRVLTVCPTVFRGPSPQTHRKWILFFFKPVNLSGILLPYFVLRFFDYWWSWTFCDMFPSSNERCHGGVWCYFAITPSVGHLMRLPGYLEDSLLNFEFQ